MIKLIGAVLIICGCGGFGFHIAALYRKEEKMMRQLLNVLEIMELELRYHLTPLPMLARIIANSTSGVIRDVFCKFAAELDQQMVSDAGECMRKSIHKRTDIPPLTHDSLTLLGKSLGHYDAEGQIRALTSLYKECNQKLERHIVDKNPQLRSYQTLGVCAGAALVILFL